MITKERLEELIKEKALIFYILNNSVALLRLNNSYGISVEEYNKKYNCKPQFYHSGYVFQNICDADKIFETKEEAEWYLEFGNIQRTETLSLPSWEEFYAGKSICFKTRNIEYRLYIYTINERTNNCRIMISADKYDLDWFEFEKPLTKENYTEACRLAKKLFLGEKE